MRLLVDEGLRSSALMARLSKAGHQLETLPAGTSDEDIWRYAQEHEIIVLTSNPEDFKTEAAGTPAHHGLLLVHGERERQKSMGYAAVAAAVENVRDVYGETLPLGTQLNLNEWRRSRAT